ncbi:MAG: hypothetical protein QOC83_4788 [Pseudonocardiales bacterium]|nr:hypothetical protein [Pseudonocardiales bacterium]
MSTPLPVAATWFASTPVDAAITLFTEPHVHPLLRANFWHLRGRDRDLVLDFDPADYRLRPARVTRALGDGDTVDLGDRAFTVLHLPGHSPGGIALFEERTGTLFSGDVVYDGELLDELDGSDIEAYLATMRRLRELPVHTVHAGHDSSFDGARVHDIIDTYLRVRSTRSHPGRASVRKVRQ